MGLGQFFSKVFGGSKSGDASMAEASPAVEYNGYSIVAAPIKDGSQYKTAGTISKEIEGDLKSAQFIRADNHTDHGAAVTHSQSKAKQIIDEQGDKMFQREHI